MNGPRAHWFRIPGRLGQRGAYERALMGLGLRDVLGLRRWQLDWSARRLGIVARPRRDGATRHDRGVVRRLGVRWIPGAIPPRLSQHQDIGENHHRRRPTDPSLDLTTNEIGPIPVVRRFFYRLRLDDLLEAHVSDRKFGRQSVVGSARALSVMVANARTSRGPRYSDPAWLRRPPVVHEAAKRVAASCDPVPAKQAPATLR